MEMKNILRQAIKFFPEAIGILELECIMKNRCRSIRIWHQSVSSGAGLPRITPGHVDRYLFCSCFTHRFAWLLWVRFGLQIV